MALKGDILPEFLKHENSERLDVDSLNLYF